MTNPPMILAALEVITTAAAADVRLNDVPVAMVGLPGGHGRAFIPAPGFIVSGPNRLAARFVPIGEEQPGAASAQVRLAVFQEGDDFFTGAGDELARIDWTGASGPSASARDFAADFGPPGWSWSRCVRWSTPQEALSDAMVFVQGLARAYLANDTQWIEAASAPKFADLARAFPIFPEAEMKAQVAEMIRSEPPTPTTSLPAPSPQLCADNRLLFLIGADGGPWLHKGGTGPRAGGAEMLLGKLDGKWQVIR